MAFRFVLTIALVASVASCQNNGAASGTSGNGGSQTLAKIPGGRTAVEPLAASTDALSRYTAPNGPIQPGMVAIGGAPLRGTELAMQGMTKVSSGLKNQAQSLSRMAGDGGNIRMPGMDAAASSMPLSIASLGELPQNMIRGKNDFIHKQAAETGKAAERINQQISKGLQEMPVRSSGLANMPSSVQELMAKSGSQVQSQVEQHLNGARGRLESVRGIADNVRNQAQGISRTLSNGAQGALSQLQKTGETVMGQLQNNHAVNTRQMSDVLGSLQGSMGSMSGNMQKNLDGLMRHARSTAQQLSGSLQKAAQMPMDLLSNIGGMMSANAGAGRHMASGGRY